MIIPKNITERYLEIENRLAQLDKEGGAAEDEATSLYLERAELDGLIDQTYLEAEARR